MTMSAFLLGCAPYPERWDQGAYRVIVASPEQVSEHCQNRIAKTHATYDNGAVVNSTDTIRTCTDFKTAKPTVFIPKKNRRCGKHEACHAMKQMTAEDCGKYVPCLGE